MRDASPPPRSPSNIARSRATRAHVQPEVSQLGPVAWHGMERGRAPPMATARELLDERDEMLARVIPRVDAVDIDE